MLPIVGGSSVFCYALLCVYFSFAIILKRKRKLVALLLLSYRCIVTIYVLWLFLTVPLHGLQYVIVVFPDHTHFHIMLFLFDLILYVPSLCRDGLTLYFPVSRLSDFLG